MKLVEAAKIIERQGDIIESSFGISQKDSAHILTILRDKLYSDKILAVVREYSCNAYDAHIEAGIPERAIEVSLPNQLEPNFKIRDFGCGLSEDDIRNIYAMYGASTKRNSNAVVGQLGLGCKSAFAYVDKFTITSFFEGTKKIYCAYLDETNKGIISLLHSEASEEPSGIEVSVPVKTHDYREFKDKTSNLYKYFAVPPLVDGSQITKDKPTFSIEKESLYKVDLIENNHGYYRRSELNLIMGGVNYEVELDKISRHLSAENKDLYTQNETFFSGIYNVGYTFNVYVPIGTFDVTASREDIEYTKHSLNNLANTFCIMWNHLTNEVYTQIKGSGSLRIAKLLYLHFKGILFAKNRDTLMWKSGTGELFPINEYIVTEDYKRLGDCTAPGYKELSTRSVCFIRGRKSRSYEDARISSTNYIGLNNYLTRRLPILIIDTKENKNERIKKYFDDNKLEYYQDAPAISITTEEEIERFEEARKLWRLDDYDMVYLSSIEVDGTVATQKVKKKYKKSYDHLGDIFKMIPSNQWKRDKYSTSFQKVLTKDIDTEKQKYYIEIYSFMPIMKLKDSNGVVSEVSFLGKEKWDRLYGVENLVSSMEACFKTGIELDDIYFIKQNNKIKLDETWTSFYDFAMEKIHADKENMQMVLEVNDSPAHSLIQYYTKNEWDHLNRDCKAYKIVEYIRELNDKHLDLIKKTGKDESVLDSIAYIYQTYFARADGFDRNKTKSALLNEEMSSEYKILNCLGVFPTRTRHYPDYHLLSDLVKLLNQMHRGEKNE